MITESLCDRCSSPGACCKRIFLSGGQPSETGHFISDPMSFERAEHMALERGLWMFQPSHQLDDGSWQFACSALDRHGRCSIYEERPDLCRRYRPAQDGLCVHFWPDPTLDLIENAGTVEEGESDE